MSATPVERLNAALEGRYRIERELGEGGMATVYLADDIKHERKVALKVLKPELAAVVGAERFLAEIKTTANLQHPHILPLFDSGEADSFLFYVMPYVDGETLRDRLDREHQLPVDEAVKIAISVAEALDYAHKQGVIHRDIKPANILLQAGKPVISDFGIALAVGVAGGGRMTETGLSLGTPHYMSPEQATGDLSVGAATDVYAVGCVLYEMLVGDPPYVGSTAQAILGKIVTGHADPVTKHRKSVTANVDAAIRKSLEKVPADRFSGAAELARALADPAFRHGALVVRGAGEAVGLWNRLSVGLAGFAALITVLLAWALLRPEPSQPVSRMVLSPDGWMGGTIGRTMAIAPDGSSWIVTVELPSGEVQLAVKMRDATAITPIPGTEGGRGAVYSPDSESIAYGVGTELYTQDIQGAVAARLATDAEDQILALDWLEDGTLLYETLDHRVIQIRENGTEPRDITQVEETINPFWAHGLPAGRGALVSACPGLSCGASGGVLYVVDLKELSWKLLLEGVNKAWYSPTGHIVYVQDGALVAAPFDLGALEITGGAVPLFQGLRTEGNPGADIHIAKDGTLLYAERSVARAVPEQLVVVDLEGNEDTLRLDPREITSVRWSPDGQSVVYASEDQIYTYNVVLNTSPTQITSEGTNSLPVFSPDGTKVAFSSRRDGTDDADLFVKDLNENSAPRSIVTLAASQSAMQWPADTLIVFERRERSGRDLWTVDISDLSSPEAREYLRSEDRLESISVSPDGSLAAYVSDESGRNEIYIRSFPDPGELTAVSEDGGTAPSWSPDGNTLYYWTVRAALASDGGGADRVVDAFMAATIQRGPTPVVVDTATLFTGSYSQEASDLHPAGDRVIVAQPVDASATPRQPEADRLILVQNFFEELNRLVPVD